MFGSLKPFFLTGFSHFSKLIYGLVLTKLTALYFGPEKLASIGNLSSLLAVLAGLSGGGVILGVIKNVAKFKNNPASLSEFLSAAFLYSLVWSIFLMIVLIVFSSYISEVIFKSSEYFFIIIILSFVQFGLAFNSLAVGTLNGLGETKKYAFLNIVGHLIALPLVIILFAHTDFRTAVFALILSPLVVAVPMMFYFIKSSFMKMVAIKFNSTHIADLSKFSLMVVTSATIMPFTEIYIRNLIIGNLEVFHAGIWQGYSRIGLAFTSFFTVFYSYSYLPKLSRCTTLHEERLEVRKHFIIVIPFLLAGVLMTLFANQILIKFALSSEFLTYGSLLKYQIIGDAFKIAGYIFGFIAVSKGASRIYICAEIIQGGGFAFISYLLLMKSKSVLAIYQAYVATSVIYFIAGLVAYLIYIKRQNCSR